jgi:hypothetical protein
MYKPPAIFPRPMIEPIRDVVVFGEAVRDRISAIDPPATKNE